MVRGGDARQVTDREEGVREFDWSPDGERLVISSRDPTEEERDYLADRRDGGPVETERLQHRFDGKGLLDDVTTYLFVVDVETRETRRLDDAYGGGAYEPLDGSATRVGTGANRLRLEPYRPSRRFQCDGRVHRRARRG